MKDSTLYLIIGGVLVLGTVGFIGVKKGWFLSAEAKAQKLAEEEAARKEAEFINAMNNGLNATWAKKEANIDTRIKNVVWAITVDKGTNKINQATADSFGIPTTNNNTKALFDYALSLKDKYTIL